MATNPLESYWVEWASGPPSGIRRGQHAYNMLYDIRPDLARRINGTEFDPFYMDSKLPAFELWLYQHWEDDPDAG